MYQLDMPLPAVQEKVWQYLQEHLRCAARRLIEALMEYERDCLLGCDPHQRTPARRGYRNGYQDRTLQSRFGLLRLRKPRVRGCEAPLRSRVFELYQRRQPEVDQSVLQWVAGGLSTRRASRAFQSVFQGLLSAGGVSRIVSTLDASVRAFHARPLRHGYLYVFLDAKYGHTSHRRTRRGRGRKKDSALLLAWGVRHDGREELIDFRAVDREGEKEWTEFLTDLERRGLKLENPWGQRLEMIVSDGAPGLWDALYMVYPDVPKQLCVFHKIQNIAAHLIEKSNREAILCDASKIYDDLMTADQARARLRQWVDRWAQKEPDAVRCFLYDFERTLTYLNAPPEWRSRLKTTNPLERFIRELNRKFHLVGVFPSSKSWERATYLLWLDIKTQGYAPTTLSTPKSLFTQIS